jgi:hypothetical protein
LEEAVQVTNSEVSGLALSLMGALPKRLLEWAQPSILSAVLLDKMAPFNVRASAAALLGIVAEARPLPEAQVAALLQVCAEGKAGLADSACEALGGLKQLDRARVLQLMSQFPGASAGLYERWAETAEAADLAALDQAFEATRSDKKRLLQGPALIRAAGRIASATATEKLSDWYVRVEGGYVALQIAAEWSRRPDVTEPAREGLQARVDVPKRLLLRVAAGDSRAQDDVAALAKRHDFASLYDAAYLAGFRQVPGALSASLLWELARYDDPSVYPADSAVRSAAIKALVHVAVMRFPARAAELRVRVHRWIGQQPAAHRLPSTPLWPVAHGLRGMVEQGG